MFTYHSYYLCEPCTVKLGPYMKFLCSIVALVVYSFRSLTNNFIYSSGNNR